MTDRLIIQVLDYGLQARLAEAIERLARPSELMDAVGATLEANVAIRLDDTKADPNGAPWKGLEPSTEKAYEKKFKGDVPGSLLDRYGRSKDGPGGNGLRAGLTHNLVGDDAVEVGFDVPYALYHETGTKHMARRGLLLGSLSYGVDGELDGLGALGDEDRGDVLELVDRFLLELLE